MSELWFILVFLIALKIPIVYLCYVVWWAVKDPPVAGEGPAPEAGDPETFGPEPGPWWRRPARRRAPLRHGPHGSPARRPAPVAAKARSKVEP